VGDSVKKRVFLGMVFMIILTFNVIMYFLVYNKDIRFWNSYIFSMIALVIFAISTFFTMERLDIRSKFYDMPLIFIIWPYTVIQLIICFFELFIEVIHYPYFLGLNSAILLLVLLGLVNKEKDIEMTSLDGNKIKTDLFIYNIHTIAESMIENITDENTKIYVHQLLDTIIHSDAFSDASLIELENEIKLKLIHLRDSLHSSKLLGEHFEELQILLAKRNRKCRLLK